MSRHFTDAQIDSMPAIEKEMRLDVALGRMEGYVWDAGTSAMSADPAPWWDNRFPDDYRRARKLIDVSPPEVNYPRAFCGAAAAPVTWAEGVLGLVPSSLGQTTEQRTAACLKFIDANGWEPGA